MKKTPQGAGFFAISIHRGSNSKPVDVEGMHFVTSVFKNLQLARPKLSGAGKRKLKKTGTDQKDTGGLMQLGYETLSHQTMGPNTPRSDKCTHKGQPSKNLRSPVEPDSHRKALVYFTAVILLDYPKG
jgi:hypothetical protein